MKIYRYHVEGIGKFPISMLHEACAWPNANYETREIQRSIENPENDGWIIKLESIKKPNPLRWEAFGCTVEDFGFEVLEGLSDQED